MFVKLFPFYPMCGNCCGVFKVQSDVDAASVPHNHHNNNNVTENDSSKGHGSTENNDRCLKNVFRCRGLLTRANFYQTVIRSKPELMRICLFKRRKSSGESNVEEKMTPTSYVAEITNVVPLENAAIFQTPLKNYIGRDCEGDAVYDQPLGATTTEIVTIEGHERMVSSSSTIATDIELMVDDDEINNKQQHYQQQSTHVQKHDLDQRPNLSPSKCYNNSNNQSNGRFFNDSNCNSGGTPHRPRFLGDEDNGGINQESYIIHRDEHYDSENDEKSSNDSTSTRIISNSTFNFGGAKSDRGSLGEPGYPQTPVASRPPSIHSSRPQSVASHKSAGSGILKYDGRLSRNSNISHSNPSIKQSADNVSLKSNKSAGRSRTVDEWYDRAPTPIHSELDGISSNQVQYESDYDEEDVDEGTMDKNTAHSNRYASPGPHPLQSSYSTEELSNNSYNPNGEDFAASSPKSRAQSASLGNLQQLELESREQIPVAPKKILKKPFLVRKSSKVAPVKETMASGVKGKNKLNEVIFQKSLRKFEKPKDALTNCLVHLESPNWEQNISGLQFFVRLIRHHPEVIDTQIHLLSVALAKQVRNLRSQVARAACQASAEFFSTHRRCIEGEAEDIATHLLHRTADTNKFLRADATHALESMCDNLSIPKVVHIIAFKGVTHQNAVVRTTAARLLDKIVRQIGSERVFALPKESRDKLILTGAHLLLEGSLDTRNYTKTMFKQLSEHATYNKVLLEVIPPRTYRNIEKSLKSIRQL